MPTINIDENRLPPPQINSFRRFVTDEFIRRKYDIAQMSTPFVRFTSCLQDPIKQYKYFTMGLSGYTNQSNIFELTYGRDKEIIGYAVKGNRQVEIGTDDLTLREFSDEERSDSNISRAIESGQSQLNRQQISQVAAGGTHPMPGVVSVNIERQDMGAGFRASVVWHCYNRQQLEFLRHHFMMAGKTVVLEWGQEFSNKKISKRLNFLEPNIDDELARCVVNGRKYVMQNYVYPNEGNYDFIVGPVANFTVNFEPKTNTYIVTTHIITSGEFLWGLNNYRTYIDPTLPEDSQQIESIASYFVQGGPFDKELSTARVSNTVGVFSGVAFTRQRFPDSSDDIPPDYRDLSTNPNDYSFVTWDFFVTKILRGMFNFFSRPWIKNEINHLLNFETYDPNSPLPENANPWIGNHPLLRSTDLEAMIIIQSSMAPNVPSEFAMNGTFDETKPDRGILSRGIWINAGAIRQSFLEATNFIAAMTSLLIKINNASAGYWNLQMYYNSDDSKYHIIDYKFGDISTGLINSITTATPLYKFNSNIKGECLALDLSSAFPPEVVTQLSLVGRLQSNPGALVSDNSGSSSPSSFISAISRYPTFASTAYFAYAMTWTNLVDVVSSKVDSLRSQIAASEAPAAGPNSQGDSRHPLLERTGGNVHTTTTVPNSNFPATNVFGAPAEATAVPLTTPVATQEEASPTSSNSARPRISPVYNAIYDRLSQYDSIISRHLSLLPLDLYPNVDGLNLVKAIIQHESNGIPVRISSAPAIRAGSRNKVENCYAYGLMQIVGALNRDVIPAPLPTETTDDRHEITDHQIHELYKPENNIRAGMTILGRFLRSASSHRSLPGIPFSTEERTRMALRLGIGSYNAGGSNFIRPTTGPQAPAISDPAASSPEPVVPGDVLNPTYVNRVLNIYNQFVMIKNERTTPSSNAVLRNRGRTEPVSSLEHTTPTPLQPTTPVATDVTADEARLSKISKYEFEFGGDTLISLIELNASKMTRAIVRQGLSNLNSTNSNSFVAPFPTTAEVSLTTVGISGISIFDGFIVDKLPYIYEDHGVFHVVGLREEITQEGWRTTINGIFRFLYFNANQMKTLPVLF